MTGQEDRDRQRAADRGSDWDGREAVLPITPSTYHAHVAKRRDPAKRSARARQDAAPKVEVRHVFDQTFSVYGMRKVWRQLKREGLVAMVTVTFRHRLQSVAIAQV
jgi:hypothetical protein